MWTCASVDGDGAGGIAWFRIAVRYGSGTATAATMGRTGTTHVLSPVTSQKKYGWPAEPHEWGGRARECMEASGVG